MADWETFWLSLSTKETKIFLEDNYSPAAVCPDHESTCSNMLSKVEPPLKDLKIFMCKAQKRCEFQDVQD
jgi:hypothetical protein